VPLAWFTWCTCLCGISRCGECWNRGILNCSF